MFKKKKILAALLAMTVVANVGVLSVNATVDFDITSGSSWSFCADLSGGSSNGPSYTSTTYTYDKNTAINIHNTAINQSLTNQYNDIVKNTTPISEDVYIPTVTPGKTVAPTYVVSKINVPYTTLKKFAETGRYGVSNPTERITNPADFTGEAQIVWNGGSIQRTDDWTDSLHGYGFINAKDDPDHQHHSSDVEVIDPDDLTGGTDTVEIIRKPTPDTVKTFQKLILEDPMTQKKYINPDQGIPNNPNTTVHNDVDGTNGNNGNNGNNGGHGINITMVQTQNGTPKLHIQQGTLDNPADLFPGNVWVVNGDATGPTTVDYTVAFPNPDTIQYLPKSDQITDPQQDIRIIWDTTDKYPGLKWTFADGTVIDDADRTHYYIVGNQEYIDDATNRGFQPGVIIKENNIITKCFNIIRTLKQQDNHVVTVTNTIDGYVEGGGTTYNLKTRYTNLDEYLEVMKDVNSNATNDDIGTYRILQYRIVNYERTHVLHTQANNNFLWEIYHDSSVPIFSSTQSSSNLKVLFNQSGDYVVNVQREYTDTYSEFVQYVVDEYWIEAETGQLLYQETYAQRELCYNPDTSKTTTYFKPNKRWIGKVSMWDTFNFNYPWLNTADPVKLTPQTNRIA